MRAFSTLGLGLCLLLAVACGDAQKAEIELSIDGMVCGSCSSAITQTLEKMEGVESVSVDHETGRAVVRLRKDRLEPAMVTAAIEKMGYEAEITRDRTLDPPKGS